MLSNSELQISSTNPGGESGCKSFCSSISWFWSCQTAFNAILFDLTTIYNNLHVDHPPKLKQSEYAVEEVKTQTNHLVAQCSCFLPLNHETTQDNKAEEPLMWLLPCCLERIHIPWSLSNMGANRHAHWFELRTVCCSIVLYSSYICLKGNILVDSPFIIWHHILCDWRFAHT